MPITNKPANRRLPRRRSAKAGRQIRFDGPARIIASFPNNRAMLDFIGQSLATRGGIPVTAANGQKCRIRLL